MKGEIGKMVTKWIFLKQTPVKEDCKIGNWPVKNLGRRV